MCIPFASEFDVVSFEISMCIVKVPLLNSFRLFLKATLLRNVSDLHIHI